MDNRTLEQEFDKILKPLVNIDEDVNAVRQVKTIDHIAPPGLKSLSDILDEVDKQEIREDLFLNAVCLELQTLRERLRHRADMMRRRANEFDEYADELGIREEAVKEYVFMLLNHLRNVHQTLDAHAHVEPTKIKP